VAEEPDRDTFSIRNTADAARSDFISPAVTPRAVVEAFVAQALRADPLLAPLAGDAEFNDLDPRRLQVPTLLLYGSRDPAVAPDVVRKFMNRLAARPQDMVVLNGADHAAHLEDTHEAWLNAVTTFITRAVAGR
jgi:pimeloyl-ACP methyl ester carboxylesterase